MEMQPTWNWAKTKWRMRKMLRDYASGSVTENGDNGGVHVGVKITFRYTEFKKSRRKCH